MSATIDGTRVRAGTLEEIRQKGAVVVAGPHCPIAVFYHEGEIHALDNRCPHMGFPLHKGPVEDNILICPWHHARFDLTSGQTFDLWADDTPSFPVEVRDGEVFVQVPAPDREKLHCHWLRRLREGMEHGLGLVIAKAVIHLLESGADYRELVKVGARLGVTYRNDWASGMTILTAMANLVPLLPAPEAMRALYLGLSRVAGDVGGQATRRERQPLQGSDASIDQLKRWLRHWTLVRHRDGAERSLLTALQDGTAPARAADLLLTAATERPFADAGHLLDFCNKAMELLDLIGWDQAEQVLPTLVSEMVSSRGGEESSPWRSPVDLVELVREAEAHLAEWLQEGRTGGSSASQRDELVTFLLGEDPRAIIDALGEALRGGMAPAELARQLTYAAALRIARFGPSNEFGDWNTVLHSFTYCNAVHQSIKRFDDDVPAEAARGILHGSMAVYLDRFLNVPPAPLPGERRPLHDLPSDGEELRTAILTACDQAAQDLHVAALAARYLELGHPAEPLIGTLAHAVLREDANFHTFQVLEAGVRQYLEWGDSLQGRHHLIAAARYIAAHAPTQRAGEQTFRIAWRLHRGESLYEEEE